MVNTIVYIAMVKELILKTVIFSQYSVYHIHNGITTVLDLIAWWPT